jgi:Spy/CpxP family protein refolding chaperone
MTLRTAALALAALALAAAPATAASAAAAAPPLASYWSGFLDHWSGAFKKQNGIVMFALLVGAVCLFVITRGKWRK